MAMVASRVSQDSSPFLRLSSSLPINPNALWGHPKEVARSYTCRRPETCQALCAITQSGPSSDGARFATEIGFDDKCQITPRAGCVQSAAGARRAGAKRRDWTPPSTVSSSSRVEGPRSTTSHSCRPRSLHHFKSGPRISRTPRELADEECPASGPVREQPLWVLGPNNQVDGRRSCAPTGAPFAATRQGTALASLHHLRDLLTFAVLSTNPLA